MSSATDAIARMLALGIGRAQVVSDRTLLGPDPAEAFAIAPVKIVAEDQVQAIAYGNPDREPAILTRWNPMSRESGDLEPFADALGQYLTGAFGQGKTPRVWVANDSILSTLDLLGRRYRTNQQASEPLRAMGVHLRALVEEHSIDGQQVVAVAATLLRSHWVTGQSPVEEGHLGALLEWIDPAPGTVGDATAIAAAASAAALTPATGVLDDLEDDRAEDLRRQAKGQQPPTRRRRGGRTRPARDARADLDRLLRHAVRREWDRVVRARRVWRDAAVLPVPGTDEFAQVSRDRLQWEIDAGAPSRVRGLAMSRMLDTYTQAADRTQASLLKHDPRRRAAARTTGHVVSGTVTAVAQPRRNFKPCTLTVTSTQPVIRFRSGDQVTPVGLAKAVAGRITDVSEDPAGGWAIAIDITDGVRSAPTLGDLTEWVPADPPFTVKQDADARRAMNDAAHPLVFGTPLPAPSPRAMPADLTDAARALRIQP